VSAIRRRILTDAQCAELWRRYKAGESIVGIGRALGRGRSAMHRVLQCTGGIAPAERRRSSRVLRLFEREEVSRGIAAGHTIRAIARAQNRAPSTVSQEVSRHGGRELYRAAEADLAAWESARRPKLCLLAKDRKLQHIVAAKLKVGSAADRRLAQRRVPNESVVMGVTRDNLSQPIRAGPRCTEEGADWTSSLEATYPSLAPRHCSRRWPRRDRGCGFNSAEASGN
jgi:Helix-turn-helix domain